MFIRRKNNGVEFQITSRATTQAIGFLHNVGANVANPPGKTTAVWPDNLKIMVPNLFPGIFSTPTQDSKSQSADSQLNNKNTSKNQYNPHKTG